MVRDVRTMGFRDKWQNDVPLLYDWFLNHHLLWPSLTCRWGKVLRAEENFSVHRIYISEQTDGSSPNTLIAASVHVPRPNTVPSNHLIRFAFDDDCSALVNFEAVVNHPGEVNKIREIPAENREIVATHTDGPDVFVWDLTPKSAVGGEEESAQKDEESAPYLVLTGHTDDAEFALATTTAGPFVLSGGKDKNVVLWNLEDHLPGVPQGQKRHSVAAKGVFKGHKQTVEDVQFNPFSPDQFCSVGDDFCLILWDSRLGMSPAIKVERAHGADIHCVDWSGQNENFLLTGSADASVKLFDRRRVSSSGRSECVQIFRHHTEPVTCVQFCPEKNGLFASGADDGLICVWDCSSHLPNSISVKGHSHAGAGDNDGKFLLSSKTLLFEHLGHREKIADLHWSSDDPFTILSSSIDSGKVGGGSLNVWRMNDVFYTPEEDSLAKLGDWQKQAATTKT